MKLTFLFITLYGFLLFAPPVVKSAQFPFHVCFPDAATMVVAEMFLVAIIIAESKLTIEHILSIGIFAYPCLYLRKPKLKFREVL